MLREIVAEELLGSLGIKLRFHGRFDFPVEGLVGTEKFFGGVPPLG